MNQSVAHFFALSECGRYPLSINYMSRCIKYWTKLLQMSNNRYPRQCYTMLKNLDDLGRRTWATCIKHLLFENGFGYVWISQDIGNANMFLNQFTGRLKDCALQKLSANINASSKSEHYKCFKTLLNTERYLLIDLPYLLKRRLANFRCSGHNLMIEKGRHLNIDREFRYCPYCLRNNINCIEDEYHMFLVCPLYSDLRQECFKASWLNRAISLPVFYTLMSDSNSSSILNKKYL